MGIMDTIYESTAPGKSDFLKGDDRETMVSSKQPFNVLHVRSRTNPRFKDQKTDLPREEWILDLRFLDVSGEVAEIDDGEGGRSTFDRTLTLGNTDFRSRTMPQLKRLVEDYQALGHKDGLGPFYLYKLKVQGQANPAYMIGDYPPVDGAVAGVAAAAAPPPPPPSGRQVSPDGKWEWYAEKNQWLPVAASAATIQVTPPPDVIRAEVPSTLPFSKGAEPTLPAPGKSQPLPSTSTVTGGDGEGGTATVTYVKGDEVRQAIYKGDGVVQTPQGGLVKMAENVEPKTAQGPTSVIMSPDGKHYLENGKWIKLPPLPDDDGPDEPAAATLISSEEAREDARGIDAESRGIASEPPPPPPPSIPPPPPGTPSEGPAPVGSAQAKAKRKTIPFQAKCDTCGKTAKGAAFKNSKDRWILTHTCDAADRSHPGYKIGSKTIDVHDQVMAILQEATS